MRSMRVLTACALALATLAATPAAAKIMRATFEGRPFGGTILEDATGLLNWPDDVLSNARKFRLEMVYDTASAESGLDPDLNFIFGAEPPPGTEGITTHNPFVSISISSLAEYGGPALGTLNVDLADTTNFRDDAVSVFTYPNGFVGYGFRLRREKSLPNDDIINDLHLVLRTMGGSPSSLETPFSAQVGPGLGSRLTTSNIGLDTLRFEDNQLDIPGGVTAMQS